MVVFNSLNSLPDDILEHIYKLVHQMIQIDVHNELYRINHSNRLTICLKELKHQHMSVSIYDTLLSVSDPFLCLPCNWEVHDVITDTRTQDILRDIKESKLQSWCRTFDSMNGFLDIDDYLRYQNMWD
jgi:hypothetical protein